MGVYSELHAVGSIAQRLQGFLSFVADYLIASPPGSQDVAEAPATSQCQPKLSPIKLLSLKRFVFWMPV